MIYDDAERKQEKFATASYVDRAACASLRSHGFAPLRRPIVITKRGYTCGSSTWMGRERETAPFPGTPFPKHTLVIHTKSGGPLLHRSTTKGKWAQITKGV